MRNGVDRLTDVLRKWKSETGGSRSPAPPEGQYLDPDKPGEFLPAVRRSGRPAWWWYAGAGVLATVAIALFIRQRRHKR